MTLKDLLQGAGTEEQLAILARADVLFSSRTQSSVWRKECALIGQTFPDRCGRYFGGQLTHDECETLRPKTIGAAGLSASPARPKEQ